MCGINHIDRRTKRWQVAVHESGHAVIHTFLDMEDLRYVTADPEGEKLGEVGFDINHRFPSDRRRRIFAKKIIYFTLAGAVFENLCRENHIGYPSSVDLQGAMKAANYCGYDLNWESPSALDQLNFWAIHPLARQAIHRLEWLRDKRLHQVVLEFSKELYRKGTIQGHLANCMINDMLGRGNGWQGKRWDRAFAEQDRSDKRILIDGSTEEKR